jgi:hypothetical protein
MNIEQILYLPNSAPRMPYLIRLRMIVGFAIMAGIACRTLAAPGPATAPADTLCGYLIWSHQPELCQGRVGSSACEPGGGSNAAFSHDRPTAGRC